MHIAIGSGKFARALPNFTEDSEPLHTCVTSDRYGGERRDGARVLRMQDSETSGRKPHHASGTAEARVWWHALLELRGGRIAVSLIVVFLIVLGLYLALK